MRVIPRAVYLSHALILLLALCHAASAQDGASLAERVTKAIEQEEPTWKVVHPLTSRVYVSPLVCGTWEADGYSIVVTLTVHPSSREAAKALADERMRVTPMPWSALAMARKEFSKANVLVSIEVDLRRDTPALAAPAKNSAGASNASSMAERVAQIIGTLISADVRVDGCVNGLYPSERNAARSPREAFFLDVESGCLPKVEQALRDGADANARDDIGTPVLARAVDARHRDVVQLLLRAGAAPNATDAVGGTAVFRIISRPPTYVAGDLSGMLANQLAILDDLLAAGARIEASDRDGRTVLLEVVRMNYDDGSPAVLLRGLIERGADVSARDSEGRTAVMLAVLNTHPKVSLQTLQILLAAGSDVNARDKSGKTALWYALDRADTYPQQEWGQCLSMLTSAGATAEVSERTGALKRPQ